MTESGEVSYPYGATLKLDKLRKNAANPNVMTDKEFNALCTTIADAGWMQPMATVVPLDPEHYGEDEYEIVAGHHRYDAAVVLDHEEGPCWVLDPDKFDRDRRDMELVKMNQLHGKLNPVKFAKLYERLTETYEGEVVQAMMGFTEQDAFAALYKEARAALPEDMQKALDDTKGELKTIDDLSNVLNRLFTEFGDTLDSNYMVFSYGNKKVFWVACDRPLWAQLEKLRARVDDGRLDLAAELTDALDAYREAVERAESLRPEAAPLPDFSETRQG